MNYLSFHPLISININFASNFSTKKVNLVNLIYLYLNINYLIIPTYGLQKNQFIILCKLKQMSYRGQFSSPKFVTEMLI